MTIKKTTDVTVRGEHTRLIRDSEGRFSIWFRGIHDDVAIDRNVLEELAQAIEELLHA